MADGGAFVDHLDAGSVERGKHLDRIVAGGFDDLDAAFDDCLDHAFVIGGIDHGQKGQVYAERLVGHLAAFGDFIGQCCCSRLGQRGNDAQSAGVGHRSGEFGKPYIMHAALDDRMFDTEKLCNACFHRVSSCFWKIWKHLCSLPESL